MERPVTVYIDTRKPVSRTIYRKGVYKQLGKPKHAEAARTIAEQIDAEGDRFPGFKLAGTGSQPVSFAHYVRTHPEEL
jgi:hypothetical protein